MQATSKFNIPGTGKVTASKWIRPYVNGRPSFVRNSGRIPGVYLIMNSNTGAIHYVGFSSYSMYDTCYRHFQYWNDRTHQHATYSSTGPWMVMFIKTKDGTKALELEQRLIKKFNPPDNRQGTADLFTMDDLLPPSPVDDWTPPF